MIDPVQAPTAAAPSASIPDPPASSATINASAIVSIAKAAETTNSPTSVEAAKAAQAAAANGASDSQADSDEVQPLRLLIERDKATNHYVYKLYDSSGRIVREIPQESLADAQKQAAGYTGSLLDTKA
jgi:uncharacterized FlaG/YvyC family protein